MPATDRSNRDTIDVVLVTARRCHFCDDARKLLDDLRGQYPISMSTVALESAEGTAIATRYRVPFPPVLLINGDYFGHGRISRRKLVRALDAALLFFPSLPHPQGGS